VSGTQLFPGVGAAVFAAQPLAVQQVRAGELGAKRGAAKSVDRVGVQVIGGLALGQQRAGPRLDPQPQSVPPAWVVSDSRATASLAADIYPLRAAASISSGSAHVET
jgi:hypothetical protein